MEDNAREVGKGQAREGQGTISNKKCGQEWQSGPLLFLRL